MRAEVSPTSVSIVLSPSPLSPKARRRPGLGRVAAAAAANAAEATRPVAPAHRPLSRCRSSRLRWWGHPLVATTRGLGST